MPLRLWEEMEKQMKSISALFALFVSLGLMFLMTDSKSVSHVPLFFLSFFFLHRLVRGQGASFYFYFLEAYLWGRTVSELCILIPEIKEDEEDEENTPQRGQRESLVCIDRIRRVRPQNGICYQRNTNLLIKDILERAAACVWSIKNNVNLNRLYCLCDGPSAAQVNVCFSCCGYVEPLLCLYCCWNKLYIPTHAR